MTSRGERLRFLAAGRAEYLHATEPEDWSEIQQWGRDKPDQLTIWVEACAARLLADILEDPERAWGWLPSWRWDEWKALDDEPCAG